MTDRPILFSDPMVRALIREAEQPGTGKTQTRRIWKLPTKGIYERPDMGGWEACTHGGGGCFRFGRSGERIPVPEMAGIWHRTTGTSLVAPYQIDDHLWVREAWRSTSEWDNQSPRAIQPGYTLYEADGPWTAHSYGKLRTPLSMPRWASRLTLHVTDVRVERLQDISEADAVAEGLIKLPASGRYVVNKGEQYAGLAQYTARARYADLWNSLHGPDAWARNPWVVAISFSPVLANIDAQPLTPADPLAIGDAT